MDDMKSTYDAWHERLSAAEKSREVCFQPWHQTVARRLPDLNEKAVLEVGCGRGDFAIWLAGKYPRAEIVAVDFSEKAIAIGKERAGAEDAQELRLDDKTFDWVISCECLEHVPDPRRMAGEIHRVLKPGGRFILTTENYFNGMVLAWLMAWLRKEPFDSGSGVQPHESFFLFWRVRRILERAGLKIDHMESNHFQWLLLPRFAPHQLCTDDFRNPVLKRLFRPFGRHFTFEGGR